ncbi:MAG: IspD/TarI family cytidylyltransferase [Leptospiraceae bacterium]|jgi:2-C-methyl-D-erythritol 4-phosphate cytidylyltransferase|nr:IspD/TarI family cytidylyltransferase [Leptospiraceae bacterium]MCZ8346327.1 IspD/TarI family cytidylyltransferase [Leptospiraceae bacterium]
MGNIHAILLAGGLGKRYGSAPKQFLNLEGESLLQRSTRRFREWGFLKQLVIVSHPDSISEVEAQLDTYLLGNDRIVVGGNTRHASFLKGYDALQKNKEDLIFIHDVARPFFLYKELDDLVQATRVHGLSTLALSCPDTILRNNSPQELISRENIYLIKTPQMAKVEIIESFLAFEKSSASHFEPTDLSSWGLNWNKATQMVETGLWNLKVTKPGDLELAKSLLSSMQFLSSNS